MAEINRLYGKYSPEKLPDVPGLLAKYGEDKLCAMVRKKYEAQEAGSGCANPKVVEVKRLYGKYNPEKLGDVPTLVSKYGEEKLLAMVRVAMGDKDIFMHPCILHSLFSIQNKRAAENDFVAHV